MSAQVVISGTGFASRYSASLPSFSTFGNMLYELVNSTTSPLDVLIRATLEGTASGFEVADELSLYELSRPLVAADLLDSVSNPSITGILWGGNFFNNTGEYRDNVSSAQVDELWDFYDATQILLGSVTVTHGDFLADIEAAILASIGEAVTVAQGGFNTQFVITLPANTAVDHLEEGQSFNTYNAVGGTTTGATEQWLGEKVSRASYLLQRYDQAGVLIGDLRTLSGVTDKLTITETGNFLIQTGGLSANFSGDLVLSQALGKWVLFPEGAIASGGDIDISTTLAATAEIVALTQFME